MKIWLNKIFENQRSLYIQALIQENERQQGLIKELILENGSLRSKINQLEPSGNGQ